MARRFRDTATVVLMSALILVAAYSLPATTSLVSYASAAGQKPPEPGSPNNNVIATFVNGTHSRPEIVIPIPLHPPGFDHRDNILLAAMISSVSGGRNLIDIEYTTSTTISWTTSCVGPCVGWDQAYFVNGLGSNGYWYQCSVMHRDGTGANNPPRWVTNIEVWNADGNPIYNAISSTTIPSDTSVRLRLDVPAYSGASGVGCRATWGSQSIIMSYTGPYPTQFVVSSDTNPKGYATTGGWSEYTTNGQIGSLIGTVTYSSPKLVDTANIQQSFSTTNLLIWPGMGFVVSKSGVGPLPKSFSAQTYTVSIDSAGTITTT